MTYQPLYAFSPLPNLPTYTMDEVRAGWLRPGLTEQRVNVAPNPASYRLPLISGNYPKSLIIELNKGTPMFCMMNPPALYTAVRSSTSYERMAMFVIGLSIAREMNALFYCTQLQRVAMSIKETITSPAIGWENTLGDIRAFVGSYGECDYVPTVDEMHSIFPIEPIVEMAVAAIGEYVRAESLVVPMIKENHSDELTFPMVPQVVRESLVNRGRTMMVPVVYVEPLKIATHPAAEPRDGPFEAQLFAIAGDVLVVPYSSDIMTISCAHNAALKQASMHGVHHIRAVISWDIYTGQVSHQMYEACL